MASRPRYILEQSRAAAVTDDGKVLITVVVVVGESHGPTVVEDRPAGTTSRLDLLEPGLPQTAKELVGLGKRVGGSQRR